MRCVRCWQVQGHSWKCKMLDFFELDFVELDLHDLGFLRRGRFLRRERFLRLEHEDVGECRHDLRFEAFTEISSGPALNTIAVSSPWDASVIPNTGEPPLDCLARFL